MSSFDPTGTEPGAVRPEPEEKVLHMKCRREGCASIRAAEISTQPPSAVGAPHSRSYRCVECGFTWFLGVGGHVSL